MTYGYSARLIALNKKADSRLLGVRLGRVCIKHNIPVSTIASNLGVSRQTVYNWFTGDTAPLNQSVDAINNLIASFP
jgi:transcriptional regulator with XRE-family HTH domain